MKRAIVVAVSDIHAGSKYALLRPGTEFIFEDLAGNKKKHTPNLNATQLELWEIFEDACTKIGALAGKDPVFTFFTGDVTDGGKHQEGQNQDTVYDQYKVATYALEPLMSLKRMTGARFVFGTPSHVWQEGGTEKMVQEYFSTKYSKLNIASGWHFLSTLFGMRWDAAHHGPNNSSRKWLEGNQFRYYLRDLMMRDMLRGKEPPTMVLRGHFHDSVWETVRLNGTTGHIFMVPSMSAMNPYARQVTRSKHEVTFGMWAYEIIDGKMLDAHAYQRNYDLRTREIIK